MRLRASRLRRGEWVALAAAVVLLAAMLLFTWADTPNPGGRGVITTPVDGWHALSVVRWLMLASILCGLGLAVAQAACRAPAVPVTLSLFTTLLGAITALALLVRVLLDPPDGIHFGGVLGLLSACALAYGGWLSVRDEGGSPEDEPQKIPTVDPADMRPT